MISLNQALGRPRSWRVAGPVLLAAVLATGCTAASSSPTPSSGSSGSSGRPGSSSSFRECLQKHGVSLPNFGGSGSGTPPTARPTSGSFQPGSRPSGRFGGANSAKFRKAIQACGGFGGDGGGFPGGGFGGSAPPG
jgi:hypothetical protein